MSPENIKCNKHSLSSPLWTHRWDKSVPCPLHLTHVSPKHNNPQKVTLLLLLFHIIDSEITLNLPNLSLSSPSVYFTISLSCSNPPLPSSGHSSTARRGRVRMRERKGGRVHARLSPGEWVASLPSSVLTLWGQYRGKRLGCVCGGKRPVFRRQDVSRH